MGAGQGVLSHPSDISIAPARSEKFLLLLCYHKWEGTSSKALVRANKKITETTNIPRDNYSFVSTQKCVWFIQLVNA